MKKLADPTKDEETALDVRPSDLLTVIAKVAADPRVDVEKMAKIIELQERVMAENRKQVFISALTRLQAEIPQIDKHGRVIVKGQLRSTFAKIEDIDTVIRPLCARYGFAFSDDVETMDAKSIKVVCKLSHEDGHSEIKSIPVPIDFNEYRTGSQSVVATITLASRKLRCMHLNIVTKEADTDGNSLEPITPEQVKDIETALADTHSDTKKFLELIAGVAEIREIPARDFQRIMNALETKRRMSQK